MVLRRVLAAVYAVIALAFALFAALLFITHFTMWRGLLFALVFGLGAVVAFRSARENWDEANRREVDRLVAEAEAGRLER
jgi:hypothetical protein